MITEHFELPAGVFVPKAPSFYVSMGPVGEDGSYSLTCKVSVCNAAHRWRGAALIKLSGVTDNDNPMELRKNLRLLAAARL